MDLHLVLGLSVSAAFLTGVYGERWRMRRTDRRRPVVRLEVPSAGARSSGFRGGRRTVTDAADQLRDVMSGAFEKRRLMSRAEAKIFYDAERAIRAHKLPWRVMAQVSLGEVLASPDAAAYAAINSKRVDVLVVSNAGDPIVAVEYQGAGHYLGAASARDAVKKEALRKAGVAYLEMTPNHDGEDLAREIARIAAARRQG